MAGAERRALVKVRTLAVLFLDAIAGVVDAADVAAMLRLCSATVQSGAVPDANLAGAINIALRPYRDTVAAQPADADPADEMAFINALIDVAIAPLEQHLKIDGGAIRGFCADQENRATLLKWAGKLLRATDGALQSAALAADRDKN